MIHAIKTIIRGLLPHSILDAYHLAMAHLGAWWYRHPSRQLIVIGVTGTKGKSTTVALITRVLEQAGFAVGVIATTHFKINDREWVNETKQTMPGRMRLQRLLREMVRSGCRYAIIETSSEGLAQHRQVSIEYDVAVFTNLSPEHIESHGSFEQYRDAKLLLFRSLAQHKNKWIAGERISKVIVVNGDDGEAVRFLEPRADLHYAFSMHADQPIAARVDSFVLAHQVRLFDDHSEFIIDHQLFRPWLIGAHNVANCIAATSVGVSQHIPIGIISEALGQNVQIPGRMEEIPNDRDVRIFVDYAHEPASLEAIYRAAQLLKPKRLIAVLGSQGGGRDKAKRPVLGRLAGQYAHCVIVTNEDPYDENPQDIIDEVAAGAMEAGKRLDIDCWKIIDRERALKAALDLATAGDMILVTGKGSETVMAVAGGKLVPWDDRTALKKLLS
ncbi:MAG: UDP-N-acetylmuramoyl-L-alanyl-D-glutamate--2,6-diaminopimelate ligase [Candidatus Kerfeldbacteria bacterium]|nr:UDP-N-acetylmuramoyl-L-alanyl-D-glutamate--2,6-diaminopimelate ligase [Candidatus Kerfeldbacteria bacterium]